LPKLLAKGLHRPTDMPDLIQFDCPSCASTLRIPIELAGVDGPCPACQQTIVAPNPYTGIGAYLAVATLDPSPQVLSEPAPEPNIPAFADPQPLPVQAVPPLHVPFEDTSRPMPPVEAPPQPDPFIHSKPEAEADWLNQPQPAEIDPHPAASADQPFPDHLIAPRSELTGTPSSLPEFHSEEFLPSNLPASKGSSKGLILGAVGVLMVAIAGGAYFLKDELFKPESIAPPLATPPPRIPPPPSIPSINPPAPDQKPAPTPAPNPPTAPNPPAAPKENTEAKPPATPAPQADSGESAAKEPAKVITAAETTLRAFLEAPDWASRSTYVLSPDTVRPKMEAYAKDNPDGPTPFSSFAVKHSQVDEETGSTLFVFQVEAEGSPGGIPVAILETPKGWLVDWESFVEFRDDQFKVFTEGPVDLKGDFHLIVTAPQGPPGTAQENENFAGFTLAPPLPDRQRTAFVRKTSPAYQQLKDATADGRIFTPVLEVAKRNAGDKQSFLEILSIKATDWRPTAK
jgi:hypothetical protein